MTESDPCSVCADEKRDHSIICVVEEPLDALALEKSGDFRGVFHILGGVLNPLEGFGPEQLQIESLVGRLKVEGLRVKEVIIATNPSLEGETRPCIWQKFLKLPIRKLKSPASPRPAHGRRFGICR